jgi:ABC-2 type transport system permease protein
MMVFILMDGLYTAIESMPAWAQTVTLFNPFRYFIEVIRMLVLKGSTLCDIAPHLGTMALFAIGLNTWAVLSYRKRS